MTVIVTTYNRSRLLEETIDAILGQTFRDFELIVVDNESVDDTEAMVKSYADERIRYFKHQNNGVIAVNRNYGIARAAGEYIAFCDDDDLWMPEKLEVQVKEMEKDNRVGLVCANGINFDERGDRRLRITAAPGRNDFSFESLLRTNLIFTCTAMVRSAVLDDVGGMDESPDLVAVEDYELWLRVASKYGVKYIHSPLGKYRVHRGAHSRKGPIEGIERNRIVYGKLLEKGILMPAMYRRRIARLNRDVAIMRLLVRTRLLGPALLLSRSVRWVRSLLAGQPRSLQIAYGSRHV